MVTNSYFRWEPIPLYEIILTAIISLMANGEQVDITVVIIDGSVYNKCLSSIGCSRIYDNHIFINANEFFRTDSCGRTVLEHELAHFKYPDKDIHNNCRLTI